MDRHTNIAIVLKAFATFSLSNFLFLLSVLALSVSTARGQDTGLVEEAHKIFIEKRCYTCHTINAEAEAIEKEKVEFAKAKGVEKKEEDDEDVDEKEWVFLTYLAKQHQASP